LTVVGCGALDTSGANVRSDGNVAPIVGRDPEPSDAQPARTTTAAIAMMRHTHTREA